jgi:hypothetical protein
MTIGKNLSGIDMKRDKSQLVTKLYPRGSGSTPSELCLNNPAYWPSAQELELYETDNGWAYFHLPKINGQYEYQVYDGWTAVGAALPKKGAVTSNGTTITDNFAVGKGLAMPYTLPSTGTDTAVEEVMGTSSMAMAQIFYMSNLVTGNSTQFRIYDVALQLQRVTHTAVAWPLQPRFIVGLYSTTPSVAANGAVGYRVPYQGPLVWCYGNLFSISTTPTWYHFPMQTSAFPSGYYAIVITPYAGTASWDKVNPSPQHVNDGLAFGIGPAKTSKTASCYAAQSRAGITQVSWLLNTAGGPYASQYAFQIRTIATDLTSKFQQSDVVHPGRQIKCPLADYDSSAPYIFHFQHAPYMQAWDAYDSYGKFEGTFKDDALTTQNALINAGAQYLTANSQPMYTVSLSAADLYDLDPVKNWAEELTIGGAVTVIDDRILDNYGNPLQLTAIITKIEKQDLTQPHTLDTLTLDNVHLSAHKMMAQLGKASQRGPKYLQGQTVETPYPGAVAATSTSPGTMKFSIRAGTTLTQAVRLTVDTPSAFTLKVDGTALGQTFSGYYNVDIMQYLTQSHTGQPTPGEHTVEVLPTS